MGFIDINGILDSDICMAEYEVRNINIKPNNINANSINVEIEFSICCRAYENRQINVIEDVYSPEEDVIVTQEKANLIKNKNIFKDVCNVQNSFSIPELANNKIYMVKVKPSVDKIGIFKNLVRFEGVLDVEILYQSGISGQMEIRCEKASFSHEFKSDLIDKNSVIDLDVEVVSKNFERISDSNVSFSVDMMFLIDMYQNVDVDIVSDIKIEPILEEEKARCSSLVIYYVKEGDTLWKIAKRFRSTVDDIASVNGIENVEKLAVGEQLFIPKYVCNRIS